MLETLCDFYGMTYSIKYIRRSFWLTKIIDIFVSTLYALISKATRATFTPSRGLVHALITMVATLNMYCSHKPLPIVNIFNVIIVIVNYVAQCYNVNRRDCNYLKNISKFILYHFILKYQLNKCYS